MSTLYWALEFTKVLLCYIFVLFIWPSIIFRKYLKNKSKIFRFSFCATTQIVLINTLVLGLGLIHLLNPWTINIFFYGSLLISFRKHFVPKRSQLHDIKKLTRGTLRWRHVFADLWKSFTQRLRRVLVRIWHGLRPHWIEYIVLFAIVAYAVIYFSYSPFVDHQYGYGDMYTHHSWTYGLIQGQIFSAGVYPEGMHCILYLMHTVTGLQLYSCNLFLGCIHSGVFLLSAYCLMREIFKWRGTALIVLTAFSVVGVTSLDLLISIARLQRTLPHDYGLNLQFLCALYLIRFLKDNIEVGWQRHPLKWLRNENLFVFTMALAATIILHFYVTIMAFFMCLPFAAVYIVRVLKPKRLVPLIAAVMCGVMIAFLPMGGALLSGMKFQGSIGWALNVMRVEENENVVDEPPVQEVKPDETEIDETKIDETKIDETKPGDILPSESQVPFSEATESQEEVVTDNLQKVKITAASLWRDFLDLLDRFNLKDAAYIVYKRAYCSLFGDDYGTGIIILSMVIAAFCIIFKLICMLLRLRADEFFDNYLALVGASVVFMLLYSTENLGLPEVVECVRVTSTAHMLLLIVAAMPIDILFSAPGRFFPNWLMQMVSALGVAVVCMLTITTGHYHGYFYNELTRYRSVVDVSNSIIQSFPKNTYTIISSTDDLYHTIEYGRHDELINFLRMVERNRETYYPTEYVFIYVEKKPIRHAQYHFSSGPKWLANDSYAENIIVTYSSFSIAPEILATEISEEDAEKSVRNYPVAYSSYKDATKRTVINSKAYKWCRDFADLYDNEMKVYYEDDDFVCYYFRQNTYSLYDLAIWS